MICHEPLSSLYLQLTSSQTSFPLSPIPGFPLFCLFSNTHVTRICTTGGLLETSIYTRDSLHSFAQCSLFFSCSLEFQVLKTFVICLRDLCCLFCCKEQSTSACILSFCLVLSATEAVKTNREHLAQISHATFITLESRGNTQTADETTRSFHSVSQPPHFMNQKATPICLRFKTPQKAAALWGTTRTGVL